EPSGRYRASSDLSLGGGVLGTMKLGPARASLIATNTQVEVNDFSVEAFDGRASGKALIARTEKGASRVNVDSTNFDLSGLITALSGRALPLASNATGKADLAFTGTDFGKETGSVNVQLAGAPAGSDVAPLSGDFAVTANNGLFQIQRASLKTAATRLTASGQRSEEHTSELQSQSNLVCRLLLEKKNSRRMQSVR